MKKSTIVFVMSLLVLCCCLAVSYAQQEGQPDDPAAQLAAEDQSVTKDQSAMKDVSEYTDSELVALYLNNPNELPEMSDEQLSRITDLAIELQNAPSQ